MAILAAVALAANTTTLVYTVPPGQVATAQVNLCNRDSQSAAVGIALTPGVAVTDAHWIEYEHPLDPKCPLERTPQRLQAGDRIYCRASGPSVSAVITGEAAPVQE